MMVLLALAPTIAAHAINDFLGYSGRAEAVREQTLKTVELRNTQLDGMVTRVAQILSAASDIEGITSMDAASCGTALRNLLRPTTIEIVLAIATPAGRVLCSNIALAESENIADQNFFRTTLKTTAFAVGGYVQNPLDSRPSLSFGYPIRDGRKIVGIVAGFLNTDWIESELSRSRLFQGENLMVTDLKGLVLANLPRKQNNWVGRVLPPEYLRYVGAPAAGTFEGPDLQGRSAIFSYVPPMVPPSNIYLITSVEKDVAFAAIRAAAWRSAALSLLSLGLAVSVAWLIATTYIRRPIGHLLSASKHWREGDYAVRVKLSHSCSELLKLSSQFNSMADAVEFRNRQLDAANRAKELIIATAGHDLRQPLQILVSAMAKLSKEMKENGQQRYLDTMQAATKRLAEGLDVLVEAIRFHRDALRTPHQSFEISDVLKEIQVQWSDRAHQKGFELRVRRCNSIVLSNRKMLLTIVHNIVGNAVKYTQSGGVLVGCRHRPGELWIEVYDTGPGIPNKKLNTVFEQFQQLHPNQEGFGLGLWIVRNSVNALGHTLAISSVVGKGSRFRLIVPSAGLALHSDSINAAPARAVVSGAIESRQIS
ncbi:MAG TPA: sensor histidine kinase [Nitrospira sp.]|nr:sensor histidine kinase [Nitrospira sp.]